MSSTPVLGLPNFEEEFTIETDVSGTGIGAVLVQHSRPLAFMSKAIAVSKQTWSTYEKEMLAVLEAIRLWRPYLIGRRFKIITDQRSLQFLLEQRITTPEQQKWIAKLVGFDYEIVYRPGRENSAADALSRRKPTKTLATLAVSTPIAGIWAEIAAATTTDPELGPLLKQVVNGMSNDTHLAVRNGCLVRANRVMVPQGDLRSKLIREFHSSAFGGALWHP